MHRISWLKIENYRSCISTECPLSDFTPLVGYNNGGKSNILTGLVWFIRPKVLSKADFFSPENPVLVEAIVDGVSDEVLKLLDDTHRLRVEPFIKNEVIRLRRSQPTPGCAARAIKLKIRNPEKDDGADDAWVANPAGIPQAIQALFPEPIQVGAMEDSAEDVTKSKTSSTICLGCLKE